MAVPFTPVTGQRILWGDTGESTELWTKCLEALKLFAKRLEASSVHILFCTGSESQQISQHEGWESRLSRQYHWQRRPEWTCFEDYLNSMKSRHRKAVRRERRLIQEQGLEIRAVRGEELTCEHWRKLRDFYLYTVHAKGGYPYLSAAFFEQGNAQAKHALAFFAYLNDEPIAGALCFHAGANLYGRYWGTQLYSPSLHFELCYYAPIEWALNNGIARYEAGAQGEHKIKRGFEPVACHSAHYIAHPRLREAIGEYLSHERANTEDELLYPLEVLTISGGARLKGSHYASMRIPARPSGSSPQPHHPYDSGVPPQPLTLLPGPVLRCADLYPWQTETFRGSPATRDFRNALTCLKQTQHLRLS